MREALGPGRTDAAHGRGRGQAVRGAGASLLDPPLEADRADLNSGAREAERPARLPALSVAPVGKCGAGWFAAPR